MLDPMATQLIGRVVERLRAMADPSRLRILARLQAGEATVGELSRELGIRQASVSKHLAILRQAGIIGSSKVGTQCVCRVRDPSIEQLCAIVCDGVQRFLREEHEAISQGGKGNFQLPRPARRTAHRSKGR
jgi:DNA-binding transcriptional ArsR family regulator